MAGKNDNFNQLLERAKEGDSYAQFELSKYYGSKITPDRGTKKLEYYRKEVLKWLKLAAKEGHEEANYVLGNVYNKGFYGQKKDHKKAKQCYEQAKNHKGAKEKLELYTILEKAQENSKKLTAEEQYKLGTILQNGLLGVKVDNVRAKKWYEIAGELGNPDANYQLGLIYEKKGDLDKAKKYYGLAEENHKKAKEKLELFELLKNFKDFENDDYKKIEEESECHKIEECLTDPENLYRLGEIFEFGLLGQKKDLQKAYRNYLNSYKKGNHFASLKCAYFLNHGFGVTKDNGEAINLYKTSRRFQGKFLSEKYFEMLQSKEVEKAKKDQAFAILKELGEIELNDEKGFSEKAKKIQDDVKGVDKIEQDDEKESSEADEQKQDNVKGKNLKHREDNSNIDFHNFESGFVYPKYYLAKCYENGYFVAKDIPKYKKYIKEIYEDFVNSEEFYGEIKPQINLEYALILQQEFLAIHFNNLMDSENKDYNGLEKESGFTGFLEKLESMTNFAWKKLSLLYNDLKELEKSDDYESKKDEYKALEKKYKELEKIWAQTELAVLEVLTLADKKYLESYKGVSELSEVVDEIYYNNDLKAELLYQIGLLNKKIGNAEEAKKLFEAAKELKHFQSVMELGGVKSDEDYEALAAIKRKKEEGHNIAANEFGKYYENLSKEKNRNSTAFAMYEKAYKKGSSEGALNLARCYELGIGCEVNQKEAFKLYQQADNRGYIGAVHEVVRCLDEGIGCKKDPKKAYKYLSKAQKKYPYNQKISARLLVRKKQGLGVKAQKLPEDLTSDLKEVIFQEEKAQRDHVFNEIKRADNLEKEAKQEGAYKIYEELKADKKTPKDLIIQIDLLIARCREEGIGCKKDPKDAVKIYKKYADQVDPNKLRLKSKEEREALEKSKFHHIARKKFADAKKKGIGIKKDVDGAQSIYINLAVNRKLKGDPDDKEVAKEYVAYLEKEKKRAEEEGLKKAAANIQKLIEQYSQIADIKISSPASQSNVATTPASSVDQEEMQARVSQGPDPEDNTLDQGQTGGSGGQDPEDNTLDQGQTGGSGGQNPEDNTLDQGQTGGSGGQDPEVDTDGKNNGAVIPPVVRRIKTLPKSAQAMLLSSVVSPGGSKDNVDDNEQIQRAATIISQPDNIVIIRSELERNQEEGDVGKSVSDLTDEEAINQYINKIEDNEITPKKGMFKAASTAEEEKGNSKSDKDQGDDDLEEKESHEDGKGQYDDDLEEKGSSKSDKDQGDDKDPEEKGNSKSDKDQGDDKDPEKKGNPESGKGSDKNKEFDQKRNQKRLNDKKSSVSNYDPNKKRHKGVPLPTTSDLLKEKPQEYKKEKPYEVSYPKVFVPSFALAVTTSLVTVFAFSAVLVGALTGVGLLVIGAALSYANESKKAVSSEAKIDEKVASNKKDIEDWKKKFNAAKQREQEAEEKAEQQQQDKAEKLQGFMNNIKLANTEVSGGRGKG